MNSYDNWSDNLRKYHPNLEDGVQTLSVASDIYPDERILAIMLEDDTGIEWQVEKNGASTYYCESKNGKYQCYLEVRWVG